MDLRNHGNIIWMPVNHGRNWLGAGQNLVSASMRISVIPNVKTFADGHRPPDQVVPGML